MPRVVAVCVAALVCAAAGFYLGSFFYRLLTQTPCWVATVGAITLYVFGLDDPVVMAPSWLLERIRTNEIGMLGTGAIVAVAALALVWWLTARATSAGTRHGALAARAAAVVMTTSRAECRLTARDATHLPDRSSDCLAEVDGILVFSAETGRVALRPLDDEGPSITVFFFRGRRTHFAETPSNGRPRYCDQVAAFLGRRVRIIGTAVNGQVDADGGHVVGAGADDA